ncbi:alpha/beta hydrolase fold domain-containing protein [Mesobacterium pallidum]|uniref:alpha/beta hydrolase fold domain-containing protein n=1 Tax=Mesobacterium pallidum TaxID=2872037 RepID=UPI001EE318B4|nr:alpha/beta hydrolase [Mesobacterium pallidum]
MTDYDQLIDAETWAFIRKTDSCYPPDAVGLDIAGQRRVYDAMCRAFFAGYPDGLSVRDLAVGGVPCRLYARGAPEATVVYFHGGGFVVGGLDSHDDVCAEICDRTGLRVLAVDYRLVPEHPHPAPFDDSLAATRAAAALWPGTLLLAGDSAGGNLAAAVAHAARAGGPRIDGVVLIYPGLGGEMTRGSYLDHAEAPMLTTRDVAFYAQVKGATRDDDPTHAPLRDTDFSNLPPTRIWVAECDPLADDGTAYLARLQAAGVPARLTVSRGLVHGHLRARHSVTRARAAFDEVIAGLVELAA